MQNSQLFCTLQETLGISETLEEEGIYLSHRFKRGKKNIVRVSYHNKIVGLPRTGQAILQEKV
jgi:hypothetical protein